MASDGLTLLLNRLCAGETDLESEVVERVYAELRRLAGAQMRSERKDHTMQPTALVNEAYLRLLGQAKVGVPSRAHFFNAAARAMRQVLIEHARARLRKKRGGGRLRVHLNLDDLVRDDDPSELVAVDEALSRLEQQEPRAAAVARLRIYSGLDNAETAEVLGLAKRTVEREWTYLRTWLYDALN